MISGFHKLSKEEQIQSLISKGLLDAKDQALLARMLMSDATLQAQFESFSENVIGNFHLPYGVVPNLVVNGKSFVVPFVTEESSVVAAAASAAKFWASRGGFRCTVESNKKVGTVYFNWKGNGKALFALEGELKAVCIDRVKDLSRGMSKRGGGVLSLWLEMVEGVDFEYKLKVEFDTKDAMGANFINSCLEEMGRAINIFIKQGFPEQDAPVITMAILSNHTPDCLVSSKVSCDVSELDNVIDGMKGHVFAEKLKRAADIAWFDTDRAVTHNKGIMNGVAAVSLATANDFRAVEAAAHAFAVKEGAYRSLSGVRLENDMFHFELKLPLAVGTIGGLTHLHSLAALSFKLLDEPDAAQLMKIIAACGLASNFSALKSLVSDGIQKGHMKMHLSNLLLSLHATEDERRAVKEHFMGAEISSSAVKTWIDNLRKKRP